MLQMQLGSYIAVAVAPTGPLGNSICSGYSPKIEKKKKKAREREIIVTIKDVVCVRQNENQEFRHGSVVNEPDFEQ